MRIRRLLINHPGGRTTDFRLGAAAFDELPSMFKHVVGQPKRAVLVAEAACDPERRRTVRRSLSDVGFAVTELALDASEVEPSLACAERIFGAMASARLTADDVLVALGAADLLSVVSFCAHLWQGGASAILLPTTLDAMVTSATTIRPLATASAPGALSLVAAPALVVCDLDLARSSADEDGRKLGYVLMVQAAMAGSRNSWDRLGRSVPLMADEASNALSDELCGAQTARRDVLKASSPSARAALDYGCVTARALRACLGAGVPAWQLLSEGLRFESRLATAACGLDVDVVFDQDDRLEALGVGELPFSLDVDTFVDALKTARFARSNRFLLSLPKNPGLVRLTSVEDDLLREHAAAYLASRAELLADGAPASDPAAPAEA